jgi:hypothetical protein
MTIRRGIYPGHTHPDEGNIRILRGEVSTVGGVASIIAGKGFTLTRNGVGDLTITFDRPFAAGSRPTFNGTCVGGDIFVRPRLNTDVLPGSTRILCRDVTHAVQETQFMFIVIGRDS